MLSSSDGSPEYEAVRQCTPELETALQQCLTSVAAKCLSKGLIPEDVIDYIHTNIPDSEKASRLLKCVRMTIKNENSKYRAFVEVLQTARYFERSLSRLQEEYSECWLL